MPVPLAPRRALEESRSSCPSVSLDSQESIAAFRRSPCSEIEVLTIVGDVTDLRSIGLVGPIAVTFLLIIDTHLQTLEGLDGIHIREVDGALVVAENADLRSLAGISPPHVMMSVQVTENPSLKSLDGLGGLHAILDRCHIQGNGLLTLHGLENLAEVAGQLDVIHNRKLASIDALASLWEVWGGISIAGSPELKTMQGLNWLTISHHITVQSEARFEVLGGLLSHSTRQSLGAGIFINGEAWPRCVTPQEWKSLSGHVAEGTAVSAEATWRSWLDNSCGPDRLQCWVNLPCQVNLTGSNFTGQAFLTSSTCGPCPEDSATTFVEAGAVADLTSLAGGLRPGNYSLCRRPSDQLGAGPVAHFSLLGLGSGQQFRCTRGHECRLRLEGHGLSTGDSVTIMRSCDGEVIPGGTAVRDEDGYYLFADPGAMAAVHPNEYVICWRPPCPVANGSACQLVQVGTLRVEGPFIRESQDVVVGGPPMTVPSIGEGLKWNDKLRLLSECGQPGVDGIDATSTGFMTFTLDVDASQARAGQYRKCWCQPSETVPCNSSQQFMADTGGMRVVCPAEQEPDPAGACRKCPMGMGRASAGLDPCTLKADYVVSMTAYSFILFLGLGSSLLVFRRSMRVEDVTVVAGHTFIKTLRPHGLHMYGRPSFAVRFAGTGHPGLDSPEGLFKACRSSDQTLELLTADGHHVDTRLDTSKGFVSLPMQQALWHTGWPVPRGITAPVLIMLSAFPFLRPAQLMERGWITALGAAAAIIAAVALRVAVGRWHCSASPLDRRIQDFRRALALSNPEPTACEKGPHRAIELDQLFRVMEFFHSSICDRSAYYMDSNIFGPLTQVDRLSYAEVVGPKTVEWFVSHYWGDPFQNLCGSLRKHAESVAGTDGWQRVSYWICFLSNNQYRIQHELGAVWSESSFFLALRSASCRGVCMVLDDLALPLTRSWCIFELLQTLELEKSSQDFQGPLLCTAGGVLNLGQGSVEVAINLTRRIGTLDLEHANASCESDKAMINSQVVQELGSFQAMNRLVCQKMGAILNKARDNANDSFERLFALLDFGSEAPSGFGQPSSGRLGRPEEHEIEEDDATHCTTCTLSTGLDLLSPSAKVYADI